MAGGRPYAKCKTARLGFFCVSAWRRLTVAGGLLLLMTSRHRGVSSVPRLIPSARVRLLAFHEGRESGPAAMHGDKTRSQSFSGDSTTPRRGALLATGAGILSADAANAKDTGWVDGRPAWPLTMKPPEARKIIDTSRPPPSIERGMNVIGWNDKRVKVPFAIGNSKASHVFDRGWSWPDEFPYSEDDFQRKSGADVKFWGRAPNFTSQLDAASAEQLRQFYVLQFDMAPQGDYRILDICSGWQSYYPANMWAQRVAITGLNELELKSNKAATDYRVKNLNIPDPRLPYEDDTFEFITLTQGIQYLTQPRKVFAEMHRVMNKGGLVMIPFSNVGVETKVIKMWLPVREEQTADAAELIPLGGWNDGAGHCAMIGNYLKFSPPNGWKNIQSVDISPDPFNSDPLWMVVAEKA